MPNMGGTGCELRYNYFRADGKTYLNCWIPQLVGVSNERAEQGKKMWENVLAVAAANAGSGEEFFLLGDLNSYENGGSGAYENEIRRIGQILTDTKGESAAGRPTNKSHELDRVFVNRACARKERPETTFFVPSLLRLGLSDHEGLIINKYN